MDGARRIYVAAVVLGLVLQGGLAVLVYVAGDPYRPLVALVLAVAVFLGVSFGARAGAVGTVVPWLVLYVVEAVRQTLRPGPGDVPLLGELVYLLSAALILGFIAWFCGALRDRYVLQRR